jgi:DNA-binding beta-propeller fold protein YncE
MKNPVRLAILSCFLGMSFLGTIMADQPLLTQEEPILVPGVRGGTDFIEFDQERGRLLAGHPGSGTLDIYDTKSGKFIASVATGAAMDTAVDPKGARFIVSVSKQQKVVMIDAAKLMITGSISLPGPADVLTYNPNNNCAYVGHDDASEIWAVDLNVGKVTTSIPVAEGPEALVCDVASNRVYANVKSADTIAVIDPDSNKPLASWPTSPAKSPHGLAIDPISHRLISVGGKRAAALLIRGHGATYESPT